MPSFIFQLASTALAFAALQIPTTTAAPVKIETINIHRSLDAEALAAQLHAAAASTVEVRQYHNIYPVMRTMSRDEYYFSTMQNNQHYHVTVQSISDAKSEQRDLAAASEEQARRMEAAADSAYVGACTAKVVADMENINAYHRGIMQEASTAYEEGIAKPLRHTVNLLELRQSRQQALALQLYSDLDIVQAAETHCQPALVKATMLRRLSDGETGSSRDKYGDLALLD